jgi:hypothetical protein
MNETQALYSLLQWPGKLLDRIAALLLKVGIDLAPLWLQLFLLALVTALLVPVWKRHRARRKADRLPLIAVVVLALVALGVLIGIGDNATASDRVAGTLSSDRLGEVRVSLVDFGDRVVSTGSGLVDTGSRRFALHYSPLFDSRARKLRITAPGCKV